MSNRKGDYPFIIVDDDTDDLLFLHNKIRSLTHGKRETLMFRDGQGLLDHLASLDEGQLDEETFARKTPAMIFLDLYMPGLDGLETLKRLRAHPVWAEVPVTLITGGHSDATIQKAQDLGANSFLPKPFTTYDVIQVLMKAHNYALASL
ncbi:MAG: response regulator [Pseudobdellovibrionaceae bacterium]